MSYESTVQHTAVPGTPHHALGGPLLTGVAATLVAIVVARAAVGPRSGSVRPRSLAVGVGVAYGVGLLFLWAVVRLLFWRIDPDPRSSPFFAAVVVGGTGLALTVQGGVPTYLHAKRGLWTPLAWLIGSSWLCVYAFLRVGGESGAFFLLLVWTVGIVPPAFLVLGVCLGVEAGYRRLRDNDGR
jgi:hypothetical protein